MTNDPSLYVLAPLAPSLTWAHYQQRGRQILGTPPLTDGPIGETIGMTEGNSAS